MAKRPKAKGKLAKRAPCKDCGRDTEPMKGGKPRFSDWDMYIVRGRVWAEAGMNAWGAGYLCTRCLAKRLGRDLSDEDYLARPAGVQTDPATLETSYPVMAKPEYRAWIDGGSKGPLPW